MISKIFSAFFGCLHPRYSFPMTVRSGARRTAASTTTGTYVVCLDCGRELAYDWQEMKIVSGSSETRRRLGSLATKEAA